MRLGALMADEIKSQLLRSLCLVPKIILAGGRQAIDLIAAVQRFRSGSKPVRSRYSIGLKRRGLQPRLASSDCLLRCLADPESAGIGRWRPPRPNSLFSRKPPKMRPSSDYCAEPKNRFTVSRTCETGVLWCRFRDQKGKFRFKMSFEGVSGIRSAEFDSQRASEKDSSIALKVSSG